jgi:hypothetical protein
VSIVYADSDYYAGWPANHGAWQWGDEFLVGFLRGKYKRKSMHNIAEPFEKMLARSMDGGETWIVEKPNVDFDGIGATPAPELNLIDNCIRVCGVYDHGGDYCDEAGAFYTSLDRGSSWSGPFSFTGLDIGDGMINTSRTQKYGNLLFMTAGQASMWGTDYTFIARHDGKKFTRVATVCDDSARAVMPSVAQAGMRIVCVMRRRKTAVRDGWIDAFASDNGGASWRFLSRVGSTGGHNGNPPALMALDDGRLLCAFGNRDEGCLIGAISDDRGQNWRSFVIRDSESDTVDIGYPQLFMRSDGVPVCVYYWASKEHPNQHIASSEVSV